MSNYRKLTEREWEWNRLAWFCSLYTVDTLTNCWLWHGNIQNGYARFMNWAAHRWSYTQFVGPIPEGLTLDHLCRMSSCVNPLHLEPVTQTENSQRSIRYRYALIELYLWAERDGVFA